MSADAIESRRLRTAAADSAAWSLFAPDDATARELATAAHDALVLADTLDGFLPLGIT
jgi:hypothetical protein